VDTHSDARSEEIVSKPGSKKPANKVKKKKAKAGVKREPKRESASPPAVSPGERAKAPFMSHAWTEEAKREAVALLDRGDATVEQVAAELGVSEKSLQRWRAEFEEEEKETPMTAEERRQFARLRKENERLRMECEILKKAATFFARHRS
jgi:transposase